MKKIVHIAGICYVLVFENNSFSFYVDIDKSEDKSFLIEFEASNDFGDEAPSLVYKDISSAAIFKLKSEIESFLEAAIYSHTPYFFRYSANEIRKLPIYTKMGKKIAKKYGYHMVQDGVMFSFYKTA